MGTFINKGNNAFCEIVQGEYVDKTGLIAEINATLNTESRYTCVTRSRRFGKSMAADMLCAYYDKSCDSRDLFDALAIANDASYGKYLNKYPVIYLDITTFVTKYGHDDTLVNHIKEDLTDELLQTYPDITKSPKDDVMDILIKIYDKTHEKFIMIIDEWDAICREYIGDTQKMDDYVKLLRRLFKGNDSKKVFAGAYLTGILPVKRYKTQSALNNFEEYSMVDPAMLAPYFGFTPDEVTELAHKYNADREQLAKWYDGYRLGEEEHIYNPYSVMKAVRRRNYKSYWTATCAYESVADYISMNYDGLKDDIISMIAGGRVHVDTTGFENDPAIIKTKDDVLTILIHLGYLAYDQNQEECYIPNMEVWREMENAVRICDWDIVSKALLNSRKLLDDTIAMDADAVARAIDNVHSEETSILSYNDENSLSCVISIAYYFARNNYIIHRELASGKGFADLVMIPRKNIDKPAIVIELKYNHTTDTAIDQIHQKTYPQKVADYTGDILLVGINYDKDTKLHSCKIEKLEK